MGDASGRPGARGHLPALDGLRGIAILLVLVHHAALPSADLSHPVAGELLHLGFAGVDLFFVLSGFLITGILLDARGGEGYYRAFYGRRLLRIAPAYYLFLAITWLVLPLLTADPSFAPPPEYRADGAVHSVFGSEPPLRGQRGRPLAARPATSGRCRSRSSSTSSGRSGALSPRCRPTVRRSSPRRSCALRSAWTVALTPALALSGLIAVSSWKTRRTGASRVYCPHPSRWTR